MHTNLNTLGYRALTAVALVFATGAAMAAGPARATSDAQERYRQEMAVCNSGQSAQDVQTCRTEARNALAEAKRGGLSTAVPIEYSRNATQRCGQFQGDDRTACEARIFNPSRVEGSVSDGGMVRETTVPVR